MGLSVSVCVCVCLSVCLSTDIAKIKNVKNNILYFLTFAIRIVSLRKIALRDYNLLYEGQQFKIVIYLKR